MNKTLFFIARHLPEPVALIAADYLMPTSFTSFHVLEAGCVEAYGLMDLGDLFVEACSADHFDAIPIIARLFEARGEHGEITNHITEWFDTWYQIRSQGRFISTLLSTGHVIPSHALRALCNAWNDGIVGTFIALVRHGVTSDTITTNHTRASPWQRRKMEAALKRFSAQPTHPRA